MERGNLSFQIMTSENIYIYIIIINNLEKELNSIT